MSKYGLHISYEEPELSFPDVAREKITVTQDTTLTIDTPQKTAAHFVITKDATVTINITADSDLKLTIDSQANGRCIINQNNVISRIIATGNVDNELHWNTNCANCPFAKTCIVNNLQKQGANITTTCVYQTKGTEQYIVDVASVHQAPHTSSKILTKGVVRDTSRALSRGLVRIEKNAPNSNGYETQKALILDKGATADAIPMLEIHNHDVKCSHGSSIGRVDPEHIHYMMTRGVSEHEAKELIVEGFLAND
jgi:Fe-S cluster assembly scaffold protein SufB